MKRALITGITGQDGSYLAELLLAKGYEVHGLVRRGSTFNTGRIEHLLDRVTLHHGDVLDLSSVLAAVADCSDVERLEVYHLAAPSHVAESFKAPAYALSVITQGTLNVLEAARVARLGGMDPRLYIASTSEMFGASPPPQGLDTPFRPCSPYGVAKLAAHELAGVYREAYGLWVARGILFNHESPRRLPTFVSRKITRGLARIALGLEERLVLGNLDAQRDWGHARDYVEAMHAMLQLPFGDGDDFIVATGQTRSIRDFLQETAAALATRGHHVYWPDVVETADRYERPLEVPALCGRIDALETLPLRERTVRLALGWAPRTTFRQLVDEMVEHDLAEAQRERAYRKPR